MTPPDHNDLQALLQNPVFNTDNATQKLLHSWFETGQIRAIDSQFGWFLQQLNPSSDSVADPEPLDWIAIVGVIVSQQMSQQHACVTLSDVASLIARFNRNMQHALKKQQPNLQIDRSQTKRIQTDRVQTDRSQTQHAGGAHQRLPSQTQLLALLQTEIAEQSARISQVTLGSSAAQPSLRDTPLILEISQATDSTHTFAPRLFLHKYWCYETRLVTRLLHFARQNPREDSDALSADLDRLFTAQPSSDINWQKIAVALAAQQKLTLITGGPGTGKTTTVAKLLWLLAKQAADQRQPLVIKMAAPTGKAAARLSESLRAAASQLPRSEPPLSLPSECTTIHRLLGVKKRSPFFMHHSQNPLSLDVLVVDEASMIDLPLLCKLFEALPEHANVILLGDNNQLASVEVGSVLGDISIDQQGTNLGTVFSKTMTQTLRKLTGEALIGEALTGEALIGEALIGDTPTETPIELISTEALSPLSDNLVHLQKSYRFHAQSGIGYLARAINAGKVADTLQLLQHRSYGADPHRFDDIDWQENLQPASLVAVIHDHWQAYFAAAKQADVNQVFKLLTQLQILCTQRRGEWGVEGLNLSLESYFSRQDWIEQRSGFYAGRPVMITENDHRLGLYNGDIGVVLPVRSDSLNHSLNQHQNQNWSGAATNLMRVWFPANNQASGQRETNTDTIQFQYFLTGQLPRHDTVYAMTTHKSQGSEFDHVVLCMPEPRSEQQKQLLNRELFYTGITRAKHKVSVFASADAVSHAVSQRCQRTSGLRERLR